MKPNPPSSRDAFTTGLGVIAATLGSAVGLGNIWKFPSLTGLNGGASFVLIYLISTLLVGLPVMIAEILAGRRARANAIQTYTQLSPSPKQPWWLIGAAGVLSAFLILAFYTEVAGWVFAYVFKSAFTPIASTDPAVTSAAFVSMISDPFQSLLWQWIVLVVVGVVILFGVSKGIENATKRLMPILFLLLVVLCVRSLTLSGAAQGLEYLFKPDFSKITWGVVLTAVGLSFFKLSVGMGTMTTYGSYFRDDQNIPKTTLQVMLADLLVSLMAGVAIFPAVFTFGFQPDSGPSLLFITIPAIFTSLPFGQVFLTAFFLLASIAAMGAMLSIVEVPVAWLAEQFKMSRRKATLITIGLLAVAGSTAALSSSTLANVTPFGKTFFDLYDFVTSNVLLPLGGVAIAIFIGWFFGYEKIKDELSNHGKLQNETLVKVFTVVISVVTPILVTIVLLNGLGILKF